MRTCTTRVASPRRNILCSLSVDSGRPSESRASRAVLPTLENNRTRPPDTPSTPLSKTHNVTECSSSQSLNHADEAFWADLLRRNGRICHNVERFLTDYVPCDVLVPLDLSWDLCTDYKPDGKTEDCDGMVRFMTYTLREVSLTRTWAKALNKLMAHIPEERRISFKATRRHDFPLIFSSEHKQKPDVAGTYRGKPAPAESSWNWDLCPIDIEIKSKAKQDPINDCLHAFKPNIAHDKPLAQIARNGRNILAASGACFCFVI